jgi:hypothetical protein
LVLVFLGLIAGGLGSGTAVVIAEAEHKHQEIDARDLSLDLEAQPA